MRLRGSDADSIKASDPERRGRADITADAPPQRRPDDLPYSEDLGGVVDPHDNDLVDAGGWSSWSAGERFAVLAAILVVAAVAALVVALVVA